MPNLFTRRNAQSEQRRGLPAFNHSAFTVSFLRQKNAAKKPIREQAADLVERHGVYISLLPVIGSATRFLAEKLLLAPRIQ